MLANDLIQFIRVGLDILVTSKARKFDMPVFEHINLQSFTDDRHALTTMSVNPIPKALLIKQS